VPLVAAIDPSTYGAARAMSSARSCSCGVRDRRGEARVARARQQVDGVEEGEVVRAGSLELNLASYQVEIAGEPLSFTYMSTNCSSS